MNETFWKGMGVKSFWRGRQEGSQYGVFIHHSCIINQLLDDIQWLVRVFFVFFVFFFTEHLLWRCPGEQKKTETLPSESLHLSIDRSWISLPRVSLWKSTSLGGQGSCLEPSWSSTAEMSSEPKMQISCCCRVVCDFSWAPGTEIFWCETGQGRDSVLADTRQGH